MTVTAPPRPPVLPTPAPPPDPEALIEEARRRARRRRLCYLAAGVLAAGAGAAAFFGFNGGGGSTRAGAGDDGSVSLPQPARSGPAPAHPANGMLVAPAGGNGEGGIFALHGGIEEPVLECKASRSCYEPESAVFSPDGRKLAFSVTSYAIASRYDGLHVLDLATRKDVMVGAGGFDLAWSRDGTQLAGADEKGLFVVGADGSERRLFAGTNKGNYSPTWSPDGRIAFAARGQGSAIWVVDGVGGRARPLADGSWPAWSPDGTRIAYRSKCGIAVITPAGHHVTPGGIRLRPWPAPHWCEGIGVVGAPAWSPDGRKLAIATRPRAAGASVYVVDADGSNLHLVATSLPSLAGGWQVRPAWQARAAR